MEVGQGFPHCEIEVRGHRLRVHLNTFLTGPGLIPFERRMLQPKRVIVRLQCCGRWGKPFRKRGYYYSTETCPVCRRQKTERFTYAELRPLLPAEWELPQ